jgi:DNA topoisomerase-1
LTVADHHPRPPGITRVPTGERTPRFRYVDASGALISDKSDLSRISMLAVPPAWTAVWISPDPADKVQVVGVDSAGRTQYRYSAAWTQERSGQKFAHVLPFGEALPTLRAHIAAGLHGRAAPLGRDHVLDVAVRLLDLGFFRVGSERYARDNETYGLTTLQRKHVHVTGGVVHFAYPAKEHLHRVVDVADPEAARWVKALMARTDPGESFLAWRLPDGGWQPVHSSHVNAYVHSLTGIDATAKQFRTWAGTVLAAAALGGATPPPAAGRARSAELAAIKATSVLLGNTPAVARAAYIHPGVLAAHAEGRTIAPAVAEAADRAGTADLAALWRDPAVQAAAIKLLE